MNHEIVALRSIASEMALDLKQCFSKRRLKASTVARRSSELACEAWNERGFLVKYIADEVVFILLDGGSADDVQTMCGKAACTYSDLMQILDFRVPVEHL